MKKTAKEILLEKQDKWTLLEEEHTGFIVKCNKCNTEQKVSKYMLLNNKDECVCSSTKVLNQAKRQALDIYLYMMKEIDGYGLLEGEELIEYIRDIIRIDNYTLSFNHLYVEAVIEAMIDVYEEKKVSRCSCCNRLYPAYRLYKGECMKKYKHQCA